jgi:hypothetical protein
MHIAQAVSVCPCAPWWCASARPALSALATGEFKEGAGPVCAEKPAAERVKGVKEASICVVCR